MASTTIQYFEYKHLPEKLQAVSKPVYDLAHQMESALPDGAEKSAGMRKLLEAKDCFVRSALQEPQKPRRVKVGDVVLYVLTDSDVQTVGSHRFISAFTGTTLPANIPCNIDNPLIAGQWMPAVVVAVKDDFDGGGVNLQVLLDGTDKLWLTSVQYAPPSTMELGTWHWKE